MVVGIDNISPGESTGKAALGGMRNYLQDLLDLLPSQHPDWKFKLFTPEWADSFERIAADNLEIVPCALKKGRLARVAFEQFGLPKLIQSNGIDVWLGTCHTLPLTAICRKVLVVQSLQFFTHPGTYTWKQKFYLRPMVKQSIRSSDSVIALSEASRKEIISRFHIDSRKIEVIHHCLQGHLDGQTGEDRMVRLSGALVGSEPFFMMVSALYPYKNHARLLEAFSRVYEDFPNHRLAIVGADSPGLRAEDLRVIAERLGISEKVLMLGRVASSDLAALYRRAVLMAMPSIDETFGLTVLEAMHFGCPVVTSNLSSMAEVAGDAALLVDPLSVDAIAHGLRRVLGNDELRRSMRAAGLKRAAMLSKDRMIGKTVAVLESAAAAVRHSNAK